MLVRPLLFAGLVTALLAPQAGCFAVDFEDGAIACGTAGCPDGLACGDDGFCYRDPADGNPGSDDPADDPNDPPPSCTATALLDFCYGLAPLPEAPVIDGTMDCGAGLRSLSSVNWQAAGASLPPSDHWSEVAVAWRPNGIYVYARVHEPELDPARSNDPIFEGDALEVYVDDDGSFASPPSYDAIGTRQFVAAAPEPGQTSRRGGVYANMQWVGNWSSDSFIAIPTVDGFAVEAFVSVDMLGTPGLQLAAGQRIGLDLAVNVSRDSARQNGNDDYLGQYFLRISDTGGSPWPYNNVAAFCTPELSN